MNETTELIMKQLNSKKVHAETHEVGGGDEIDVTKLKNIEDYVTIDGDFTGTWNGVEMTNITLATDTALLNHATKLDHMRGDQKIDVGPSGYAFTSIQAAINSVTNASANRRVDIIIHPGTYAETITTKDYVNLIGDHPYTCIIDYTAPTPANWANESTIFATSTSLIENLTIKAKNAKYPIHSDVSSGAFRLVVRNCQLIHSGSTDGTTQTSGTPIGIGLYKNQFVEIYDSILQGYNQANDVGASGVYCHNQADTSGTGFRSVRVVNCDIRNVAYGIRLEALAGSSGQNNDAYLIGNRIQSYLADVYYSAAATDLAWVVKAHGNNIRRVYQPSNNYIVEEPGRTVRVRASAAGIVRGSVVTWFTAGYSGLVGTTTTADYALVTGVAMQDIPNGTEGVVQIAGWCNAVKVNGTTPIAAGDNLSTFTVSGIAKKSAANPFAIALGAYSTADSNGMISAIINKTMWN